MASHSAVALWEDKKRTTRERKRQGRNREMEKGLIEGICF